MTRVSKRNSFEGGLSLGDSTSGPFQEGKNAFQDLFSSERE